MNRFLRSNFVFRSAFSRFRLIHELINLRDNRLIFVFGTQRSGNHMFIEWLCSGLGNTLHLNHCYLLKKPKFKFCIGGRRITLHKNSKKTIVVDPTKKHTRINQIECLEKLDLQETTFTYSFENLPVYMGFLKKHSKHLRIVILRDPANFIASYFKYVGEDVKHTRKVISTYISYLKLFENKDTLLFINFNKFVSDESYRKIISNEISNHSHTLADATLSDVSDFGGGSSFSKLQKSPKVFDRWEHYRDNKAYKDLLRDKELIRLSKLFFDKLIGFKAMNII